MAAQAKATPHNTHLEPRIGAPGGAGEGGTEHRSERT